jgi:hypothetical protein
MKGDGAMVLHFTLPVGINNSPPTNLLWHGGEPMRVPVKRTHESRSDSGYRTYTPDPVTSSNKVLLTETLRIRLSGKSSKLLTLTAVTHNAT